MEFGGDTIDDVEVVSFCRRRFGRNENNSVMGSAKECSYGYELMEGLSFVTSVVGEPVRFIQKCHNV